MKEVVSVEWLSQHLNDENVILLDASLPPPASKNELKQSAQTIPGAQFADLKHAFADADSAFPNTIPSPAQFEHQCRRLGIHATSHVIAFDQKGVYSSPRLWWLFKVMGHEQVSVLNGGLPEWIKHGYETVDHFDQKMEEGSFKAHYNSDYVKKYQDIVENSSSNTGTIVDARSEGRFNGTAPEPRKHLQSGSIPHSVNIPFQKVLDNGKFKSKEALKELFRDKCTKGDKLIFSCGSGITACIIMLACTLAFDKQMMVYDGSWTEWAELQGLRIE
ncbi:MAG: sulfurtransferase [Saprospiraceae bacterium]|nr:sulfurtransferase [Saprospiraceae bacterium]